MEALLTVLFLVLWEEGKDRRLSSLAYITLGNMHVLFRERKQREEKKSKNSYAFKRTQ